jgi:tetratricopeptide (TPR) repeat protein
MGVVYAAYDPRLDRRVAIKVLHVEGERARARILAEARALAKLSHPNVVTVYDASDTGEDLFIAMEYVAGRSLRAWLAERPRRTEEIIDVLVRAGRGIAAAHATHLVHGDIKPENVLVGGSAVKVVDFGLARSPQELLAEAGGGTPAYMAPAQLAGAPADVASDQFAFAVMAYEVLAGARPFQGGNAMAAMVASPPPIAKLSSRRMRALSRALSPDAEQRHPSIEALLGELVAPPPRWPRVVLAGVVVTAVVAGVALRQGHVAEPVACASSGQRLASAWTPASLEPGVAAILEDYGHAWTAMADRVCQATRDGEQSAAQLDLRMSCLDRRLDELGALAGALASSGRTPREVAKAREAAYALSPLEPCADRDQLGGVAPPSLAMLGPVAALRARLDRARGMQRTAAYPRALADATAVVEEARAVSYQPLVGEALLARGLLETQASRLDTAATSLDQAAHVASAALDDETTSNAWAAKVFVATARGGFAEALAYASAAEAAASRLREPAIILAKIRQYTGQALVGLDRLPDARASYEEALRLASHAREHNTPLLGEITGDLADVCLREGDLPAARTHAERAHQILLEAYGPAHEEVAITIGTLASIAQKSGDNKTAIALYRRGLADVIQYAGSDHVFVAIAHGNLGDTLRKDGQYDEAARELEAARALWQANTGLDSPNAIQTLQAIARLALARGDAAGATAGFEDVLARKIALHHGEISSEVADTLNDLGNIAKDANQLDRATEYYTRALTDYTQALGPEHPRIPVALSNLGEVALLSHHYDRAVTACERALAIDEKVLGKDHPDLAYDLICLGQAHAGLHDPRAAVVQLERALVLRAKSGPTDLAQAQFALARALLTIDAKRARALATTAHDAFVKDGKGSDLDRENVEAWLAGR